MQLANERWVIDYLRGTHMDAEPQEIRKMFDSVALRAGLDQQMLFEWCRLCLY